MTYKDTHDREIKTGCFISKKKTPCDEQEIVNLEAVETNYLLDTLRQINNMLSGCQKEYHDIIMRRAKVVHCVPIAEVLTPEQIKRIKEVVNPQVKECFKNAQNVAKYISEAIYVEGQFGVGKVIGVEHGFNRIGDKYFDVTAELALGKDVTKEDYLSILEVENSYDILSAQLDLKCYTALIPYFVGKKYLV